MAELVASAILGVTAWVALWAGIVVGLVEMGLALLLVLALSAVSAWLAVVRLKGLLPLLRLPATRRQLTSGHGARPATPAPSA